MRAAVDAAGRQDLARDVRMGAATGLHAHPAQVDAPDLLDRVVQRQPVLPRPADQQRAVDVEQQEHAQRSSVTSTGSRRANAAISFAVFSTSSSCTISTGECM